MTGTTLWMMRIALAATLVTGLAGCGGPAPGPASSSGKPVLTLKGAPR